jgi:hypothetical protein
MENVRFFLIDELGMVLGECPNSLMDKPKIKIDNPVIIQPSSNGTFAMSTNAFFEEHISVMRLTLFVLPSRNRKLLTSTKNM